MRISVVKVGNTLAPIDDEGLNALQKIPQGELVTVELTRPRNPRCSTRESVSDFLKIAVSHVTDDGKPRSISFESMEQTEFESFYSRVSDVVAGLLSTTPDTIRVEIEALTGQRLG